MFEAISKRGLHFNEIRNKDQNQGRNIVSQKWPKSPTWCVKRWHYYYQVVGSKRSPFFLSNFEDFVLFLSHGPLCALILSYFSEPQHQFFALCVIKRRGKVAEWKCMELVVSNLLGCMSCFATYIRIAFVKLQFLMWKLWKNLHLSKLIQDETIPGKHLRIVADTVIIRHYCSIFVCCVRISLAIWIKLF